MSDNGSDENDCHTPDLPCKSIQTVFRKASAGVHVLVASDVLTLPNDCSVTSSFSFNLSSSTSDVVSFVCAEGSVSSDSTSH